MQWTARTQAATHLLAGLLIASYAAAMAAFFFHALNVNPQYDTQVIRYAQELNDAVRLNRLSDYLFEVRKYPLLYTLPFAAAYDLAAVWDGRVGPSLKQAHMLGRLIGVAYAVGTLLIVWQLSRKMFGGTDAAILLLTSILFLEFATAIRPHIAVTFWTTLTFAASLTLRERRSAIAVLAAFGSAFMAFGTLQSGLFAFLFPVWAYAFYERTSVRGVIEALLLAFLFAGIALCIAYPFILAGFFGYASPDYGLDLGHGVGLAFDLKHAASLSTELLGSETTTIVFAGIGVLRLWQQADERCGALVPVLAYVALYTGLFLFHPIAGGRFFLVTLPFLALLGARAFAASPQWIRTGIILLSILVCAKFAYLASVPNTFEQLSAFVRTHPGQVALADLPQYFFTIRPERYAHSIAEQTIGVIPDYADKSPQDAVWRPCAHLISSTVTNANLFLWVEVPWSLYHVFMARSLGPNLTVFCRREL